jgi:hypothetical protein
MYFNNNNSSSASNSNNNYYTNKYKYLSKSSYLTDNNINYYTKNRNYLSSYEDGFNRGMPQSHISVSSSTGGLFKSKNDRRNDKVLK